MDSNQIPRPHFLQHEAHARIVRVIQQCRDPESNLCEIAQVADAVPALSQMILKASNAVPMRTAGKITSLEQAVLLLGANRICTLAEDLLGGAVAPQGPSMSARGQNVAPPWVMKRSP